MPHADEAVRAALQKDNLVDITTTGRRSGRRHRVEVNLRYVDGEVYLSNRPTERRDWAANLHGNPNFTYHLKQSLALDIAAKATPVRDTETRRKVFERFLAHEGILDELDQRLRHSNLFLVELLGPDQAGCV